MASDRPTMEQRLAQALVKRPNKRIREEALRVLRAEAERARHDSAKHAGFAENGHAGRTSHREFWLKSSAQRAARAERLEKAIACLRDAVTAELERTTGDLDIGPDLRRDMGLLSDGELAALLRVTTDTLRNWRTRREGPPSIKAGSTLYRREAVLDWLRTQERSYSGSPPARP